MNYDDIINIKHFEPKHPRMSIYNRSAQFAPFAALTGFEDKIKETARLTDELIEISEDQKVFIDNELSIIEENIKTNPLVKITYFEKDKIKSGGKYISFIDNVKKIDKVEQNIYFVNKKIISLYDIYELQIIKNLID